MKGQRIAVVGIGAIGGTIAADLSDLKRHALLLCARSPFDRLELRHPGGLSCSDAPVVTDPTHSRPSDWVLLATKAHQSEGARPWLEALCRPGTRVAVLQNGVDHVDRIQPLLPDGTEVVPVVLQLPADKSAPGRIIQSRNGVLMVPDDDAGRAFVELFEGSRNRVEARPDFLSQAWWKLLSNAALGGVCALTVQPNRMAGEPDAESLVLALMREVAAVGRAAGATLPDDAPEKVLHRILAAVPDHWSSITVDRREGRPMEWEVRNAVVGRLGRRYGVETPLNDVITTLLRLADTPTRD